MLTVAEIEALQKSPKKTSDKIADGSGLYLFVTKKSKTWKYLYRFNGKQNTYTIGTYPNVLPKEARLKLSEAKALVNQGVDPNLLKRQKVQEASIKKAEEKQKLESESNTFEVVARKWFALQLNGWSDSHAEKQIGRLELHVFPFIGQEPVSQLRKSDTIEVIEKIVRKKNYETASRVYQIMKNVFEYANDRDLIDSIPMTSKKSLVPAHESKKLPAITDEKRLGVFLRAVLEYKDTGEFITVCAFKAFVYLPIRQGEFRQAKWSEFDLDKAIWTIPAAHRKLPKFEKSNPKNSLDLHIPHQVISILKELHTVTGSGDYLFPNQKKSSQGFMSENTITHAIHSLGFKGEMTAHGIRSTFSTLLNEHGFDAAKIDMLLGHKKKDKVESRYNRAKFAKDRKEMMQYYADYIDQLRAS